MLPSGRRKTSSRGARPSTRNPPSWTAQWCVRHSRTRLSGFVGKNFRIHVNRDLTWFPALGLTQAPAKCSFRKETEGIHPPLGVVPVQSRFRGIVWTGIRQTASGDSRFHGNDAHAASIRVPPPWRRCSRASGIASCIPGAPVFEQAARPCGAARAPCREGPRRWSGWGCRS
jgi:hypothetical protein